MEKQAKYTYGDVVSFEYNGAEKEGVVEIIDVYGTPGRPRRVSYDIFIASENMLYKHVPEKYVLRKVRDAEPEERIDTPFHRRNTGGKAENA